MSGIILKADIPMTPKWMRITLSSVLVTIVRKGETASWAMDHLGMARDLRPGEVWVLRLPSMTATQAFGLCRVFLSFSEITNNLP